MDGFIATGSAQGCYILQKSYPAWYESKCLGFTNTEGYFEVGVYFWIFVGLVGFGLFLALYKGVSYAFGD